MTLCFYLNLIKHYSHLRIRANPIPFLFTSVESFLAALGTTNILQNPFFGTVLMIQVLASQLNHFLIRLNLVQTYATIMSLARRLIHIISFFVSLEKPGPL